MIMRGRKEATAQVMSWAGQADRFIGWTETIPNFVRGLVPMRWAICVGISIVVGGKFASIFLGGQSCSWVHAGDISRAVAMTALRVILSNQSCTKVAKYILYGESIEFALVDIIHKLRQETRNYTLKQHIISITE